MPKTIQRLSTPPPAKDDPYLTTEELAARYRTAASTIRFWRHSGTGPRGVLIGRRVLYKLSECERWEQEQADRETAS